MSIVLPHTESFTVMEVSMDVIVPLKKCTPKVSVLPRECLLTDPDAVQSILILPKYRRLPE